MNKKEIYKIINSLSPIVNKQSSIFTINDNLSTIYQTIMNQKGIKNGLRS